MYYVYHKFDRLIEENDKDCHVEAVHLYLQVKVTV